MRKNIVLTIFIFFFSVAVVAPFATNARLRLREPFDELAETYIFADKAGFDVVKEDPYTLVGTIINTFLGLLGILFLGLIIYGGFKWMNAQGAEEDVTKAKNIITQAVIGLVIIMAAYAISAFVIKRIQEKTLTLKTSLPTRFV